MKRMAGALIACLAVPAASHAEWASDSTLLTLNLGWATATSRFSDDRLHAGSIGGTVDFIIPDETVSFGLGFGVITADEDTATPAGDTLERRYNTATYTGTFKIWFGGTRAKGFTGLGMGFHSTKVEAAVGSGYDLATQTSFHMGVPLGLVYFVGDRVFLAGTGMVSALGESPYRDNVTFGADVGLGFKIGRDP